MTPEALQSACDKAGGVYRLAELLDEWPTYLYRRLRGEVAISRADELAIAKALEVSQTKEGI